MAIEYTEKVTELGWSYIEKLDTDKPESIAVIPIDAANSDYQEYLKTLEA